MLARNERPVQSPPPRTDSLSPIASLPAVHSINSGSRLRCAILALIRNFFPPAVSVAPAIANAVYHATGTRVRDLPITVEKML